LGTPPAIADDIEIVVADVSDPIEVPAPEALTPLETALDMVAPGEPAMSPIPDEPDEAVAPGDVFAPALEVAPTAPSILPNADARVDADVRADADARADVFAPVIDVPAVRGAEPADRQPMIVAVGATLRVAEVAALATASPAPLMAVETAADPLQALTPVMRLNLMG
jgi:hypothetical protein